MRGRHRLRRRRRVAGWWAQPRAAISLRAASSPAASCPGIRPLLPLYQQRPQRRTESHLPPYRGLFPPGYKALLLTDHIRIVTLPVAAIILVPVTLSSVRDRSVPQARCRAPRWAVVEATAPGWQRATSSSPGRVALLIAHHGPARSSDVELAPCYKPVSNTNKKRI